MTDAQLNEIEKLAEAATPGPWGWTHSVEVADLWAAGGAIPVLRAWSDNNIAFIQAMREYALPLVKALREARVERDEARAEVERLNKRLESEQHFIDAVCHYRNLAIVLGAKPEQMLGKFDRELCESGIDPDETSGGYHISVNQQLDELKDVWGEVERLKAERDEARKWLEGICSEFEGAVAHADWRAAGSKGMSVPFTGDFADMTRHPGVIGRMRWWVRVFRAALKGEQP